MTHLYAIATLTARPGTTDEFLAVLEELRVISEAEPGTVEWTLLRLDEPPGTFVIVERFTDHDASQAHETNPAVRPAGKRVRELAASIDVVLGGLLTDIGAPRCLSTSDPLER